MQQYIRKWGVPTLSCLFALLLATACFQSAGDSLQATSVAQGFSTFTPIPSPTEEPTNTPEEIAAPEETEAVGDIQIVLTATPDPFATPDTSEEETQQAASIQQQIEIPEMTATALIERATQQAALEMTMTADAISTPVIPTLPPTVVFPTATPPITDGGIAPILPGGSCVHVVSRGENLFRISLRYGTTVHVLAAANGIPNINLILVGQRITIPNCSGGGVPTPPPGGGTIHTVMQGENLFRISLRYGVTLSALLAANPQITNPNLIFINQQIVIPI
jgi:LysM repeat protein